MLNILCFYAACEIFFYTQRRNICKWYRNMMFKPKNIFGFKANPKESAEPIIVANTELRETSIGEISIDVLRREIKDFEIEELNLTDGYFVTYQLSVDGKEYNYGRH